MKVRAKTQLIKLFILERFGTYSIFSYTYTTLLTTKIFKNIDTSSTQENTFDVI